MPQRVVKNGQQYFGFSIDGFQRFYFNYADACAEKIIFIVENLIFKFRKNGHE